MSEDYTNLSTNAPVGQYEQQARTMFGAALNRTGGGLNPQLASEALNTQSVPAVTNMVNNDPAFGSFAGLIPGTTGQQPYPPSQPSLPSSITAGGVDTWDEAKYKQSNEILNKFGDTPYKALGGIPMASMGYVNYIQNQLVGPHANHDMAKTWQQRLKDAGYFVDPQGAAVDHPTDGNWDSASAMAFANYMIANAAPTAAHDPDPTKKAAANYFIKQLSSLYNPTAPIDMQSLSDAATKAGGAQLDQFQHQLYDGWQRTIPGSGDPGQHLGDYVHAFGADAVPANWAKSVDGGIINSLLTTIRVTPLGPSLLPIKTLDDLTGMVPWVKDHNPFDLFLGTMNQVQNWLQGRGTGNREDPQKNLANEIKGSMTASDQQYLQQHLADIQDSQGFYGALDGYNKAVTKAQLSVFWAFGDAVKDFSGDKNPLDATHVFTNMWDPTSQARTGARAHQDNIAVGLFGQQWVDDHKWAGAVTNITASFVDPTIILGPVGRAARLGKVVDEVRAAMGAVDMSDHASKVLSSGLSARVNAAIHPFGYMKQIVRASVAPVLLNPDHDIHDITGMLEVQGHAEFTQKAIEALFDPKTGARKEGVTESDALALWDSHQRHAIGSLLKQYNYVGHLRALGPAVQARVGAGGMEGFAAIGSMSAFGHGEKFSDEASLPHIVETMKESAALAGIDTKELTPLVNRMYVDAGMRPEIYRQYQERLLATLVDKFGADKVNSILDISRNGGNTDLVRELHNIRHGGGTPQPVPAEAPPVEGAAPDAAAAAAKEQQPADKAVQALTGQKQQLYAPDKAGRETSVQRQAPVNRAEYDVATAGRQALDHYYWETVGEWFQRVHGRAPAVGEGEAAVREFEAVKENRELVDGYRNDSALLDDAMAKQFPKGEFIAKPLTFRQLKQEATPLITNFEIAMLRNSKLATSELFMRKMRLDALNHAWKLAAIAKPSTVMRAMAGDDIIRFALYLGFLGSPGMGMRAIGNSALLKSGYDILRFPDRFATVFGEAFGKGIAAGVKGAAGREKAIAALHEKMDALRIEASNALTGFEEHSFHEAGADDPYHRPALEHIIRNMTEEPLVRTWAKVRLEKGPEAAKQWAKEFITSEDPQAVALRQSRGMIRHSLDWAKNHEKTAADLRAKISETDARVPDPTDPRYDSNYRSLARHNPTKGSYRDRAIARSEWHDRRADGIHAMHDWVDQFHHQYSEQFQHPDLLQMLADGKVDGKKLDTHYSEPDLRRNLPTIQVRTRSVIAHNKAMAAVNGKLDWFMKEVFANSVGASRAAGAERIRRWWQQRLTDVYQGEWTPEQISEMATLKATDFIKNSTYQGSRTIADYAMRNAFPFVGATLSMDRFLLKTVREHPWTAGPLAKAGLAAEQANQDRSGRGDLFGIGKGLGNFGFGEGSVITANPFNLLFYASDGIASTTPGPGPMLIPLVGLLSRDHAIKSAVDTVWPQAAGRPASIVPGVAGAGLNLASDTSMFFGGPPITIPAALGGTVLQPQDYQRYVDQYIREQFSKTGVMPTDDEAKRAVAEQRGFGDVMNFLTPFQTKVEDQRSTDINKARNAYDKATTADAKIKILDAHPDIAPFLQYVDPTNQAATPAQIKRATDYIHATDPTVTGPIPQSTLTQVIKDQIAEDHPWVVQYASSYYDSTGHKPVTLQQFQDALVQGNEHIQGTTQYQQTLVDQMQIARGFDRWRTEVHDQTVEHLQQTGESTSDPAYKQWYQQQIEPIMADIRQQNPAWTKKWDYSQKRDFQGQQDNSVAIASLTSWAVMPHYSGFRDASTSTWQDILNYKNQTAATINDLRSAGATQAQLQDVVQTFHQQMLDVEAAHPELSAELDLYHWGRWQDFVGVQTTVDQRNTRGY